MGFFSFSHTVLWCILYCTLYVICVTYTCVNVGAPFSNVLSGESFRVCEDTPVELKRPLAWTFYIVFALRLFEADAFISVVYTGRWGSMSRRYVEGLFTFRFRERWENFELVFRYRRYNNMFIMS